jgi:hypothetical protein
VKFFWLHPATEQRGRERFLRSAATGGSARSHRLTRMVADGEGGAFGDRRSAVGR